MKKLYHILLIVLLICVTGTVLFLILSPDRVPMHFNAAGEPDRIGSKYENVMWPLLAGASVLLFLLLARREKKKGMSPRCTAGDARCRSCLPATLCRDSSERELQ